MAGPLALRSSVLRPLRPLALGSAVLLRWPGCRLLLLALLLLMLFLPWRLARAWL